MAHTVNQVLLVVFAAIQVGGTIYKWVNVLVVRSVLFMLFFFDRHLDVKEDIPPPEDPDVSWNFNFALRNEIGLVSVMFILSILFMYLCWKLYKQFGWNIYKRIGADIEQQGNLRMLILRTADMLTINIIQPDSSWRKFSSWSLNWMHSFTLFCVYSMLSSCRKKNTTLFGALQIENS